MRQRAFDHISIPATSAETERVFSDTELFISDLRGRLGSELIEALEVYTQMDTSRAKVGVISASQSSL